ncbi:MAG: molybdenum cofactor biosynthesis protein MoaB [Hyperthermus sp.]|nr:MAG: molybdenum cofactor biosynthesis protein MoaB [Hyperthermus sp.]
MGVVGMVRWALIVTSDTVKRDPSLDKVTPLVKEKLKNRDNELVYARIVGNNPFEILHAVSDAAMRGVDVILLTGGTGPNPRDVTVDLLSRLADREIPGVGEEFRRRSLSRGVRNALLSRASAFTFYGKLIIASPGSPDAVEAMLEVVLPVIGHLVEQLKGGKH